MKIKMQIPCTIKQTPMPIKLKAIGIGFKRDTYKIIDVY